MVVFPDFNGMIEIFFAVCSIQIISVVKFLIIYSKFLNTSMNEYWISAISTPNFFIWTYSLLFLSWVRVHTCGLCHVTVKI